MSYVELHASSAFSFLRGASNPEDLVPTAARLDLPALALCDRDGLYGAPRLHAVAKEHGVRALVGAELTLEDKSILPVLVANRTGYQNLCRLITEARLRGTKTESTVLWKELPAYAEGLLVLTGDEEGILKNPCQSEAVKKLETLMTIFGKENIFVEIQRHLRRGETWRNNQIVTLARAQGLSLVATNGVLHARPDERRALDLFTCVRHHTNFDAAGRLLSINAERNLKSARQMELLFADLPEAIANTVRIAERIEFTLENLGYEFPKYPVPPGETMDSFLRTVAFAGARARYSHLSAKVLKQLRFELDLICRLGFSGYFLIVWDIANYCSQNDIFMQGRGSAANSVVCYSLGITACDPIANNLLFERFLSEGRKTWPDIDLDLPSGERRESVIQEVYRRYGKHGAAMTANVITYRGRSAMREIGKALNFSPDIIDRFSSLFASGDFPHTLALREQLQQAGIPFDHPRAEAAILLYQQIYGLPRHLGQHSGGMIICQGALSSVVPLENASMPGRVVAQWDKDDCEDLGIIKVDLLGLGMMAAMQDALTLSAERQRPVDLAAIPKDDPAVYDLMTRADTIGTFQVESRAQMATLPRLKPKCFYDVVVEVAIIRPGPIQGHMVHPYLARREGTEPVTYIDERLRPTLERTLGVPLFQEQLLKMAMVMADFSGSEAEELRRALSFHRSQEKMEKVCVKLRSAMAAKNINPEVIEKVVHSVQSFAVYGFPESHAISFALIAYASCWLKLYRSAEFYCALLNNQPMGFYNSATLIHDAKAHGVVVRPISVLHSEWLCTIENDGAIRLGLSMVKGMDSAIGKRIAATRNEGAFVSLQDFQNRVTHDKPVLRTLSRIGALNGLVKHRRDGLWKIEAPNHPQDLPDLEDGDIEIPPPLAPMTDFERLDADFAGTGVTTGRHPMALIREQLPDVTLASDLPKCRNGQQTRIAGLVICRQRPGTAKGFVFLSLEDESGVSNAIIAPQLFEQRRLTITQESFLSIHGKVQNTRDTILVQARRIDPLPYQALGPSISHDFH
jgi:error-prone DNA polymerase